VVWIAAVAGDTTGYLLGRTLGRPFVEEHGHRFYLTPYRLRTVEEFVDAHGAKAIIFGRFVGVLRAFGPFTAGASGLSAGRFIIADVVGAGVWAAVFTTLGYVFASRVDDVFAALGHAQIILVSSLVVGAAVVVISRRRRGGRAERSAASAAGTDNRDSATASGDRYGREMGGCRDEI
jgi:membrane protein DedA with SNARE-associated domain